MGCELPSRQHQARQAARGNLTSLREGKITKIVVGPLTTRGPATPEIKPTTAPATATPKA
jgi:hypothetical protein